MINTEYGTARITTFIVVGLSVFVLGLGIFSVWSYANYLDQKNNTDSKISVAVSAAKTAQKDSDSKYFAEQEKLPTRQFVGPSDLGALTFNYPKTWSVFVSNDGSSGTYEAYLNPDYVIKSSASHPAFYAHVLIDGTAYENVLKNYQSGIASGTVKASPITINGSTGVHLTGLIDKGMNGAAVIFKVRDKTIRIFSELPAAVPDFDNIILPSIKFNV